MSEVYDLSGGEPKLTYPSREIATLAKALDWLLVTNLYRADLYPERDRHLGAIRKILGRLEGESK